MSSKRLTNRRRESGAASIRSNPPVLMTTWWVPLVSNTAGWVPHRRSMSKGETDVRPLAQVEHHRKTRNCRCGRVLLLILGRDSENDAGDAVAGKVETAHGTGTAACIQSLALVGAQAEHHYPFAECCGRCWRGARRLVLGNGDDVDKISSPEDPTGGIRGGNPGRKRGGTRRH